jgi:hypothetical protein
VIEVRLTQPIVDTVKQCTIEVITLRQATLKDLRLADEAAKKRGDIELGRQLLAQCSGLLPADLDKLSIVDFNALSRALSKLNGGDDAEAGEAASGGF